MAPKRTGRKSRYIEEDPDDEPSQSRSQSLFGENRDDYQYPTDVDGGVSPVSDQYDDNDWVNCYGNTTQHDTQESPISSSAGSSDPNSLASRYLSNSIINHTSPYALSPRSQTFTPSSSAADDTQPSFTFGSLLGSESMRFRYEFEDDLDSQDYWEDWVSQAEGSSLSGGSNMNPGRSASEPLDANDGGSTQRRPMNGLSTHIDALVSETEQDPAQGRRPNRRQHNPAPTRGPTRPNAQRNRGPPPSFSAPSPLTQDGSSFISQTRPRWRTGRSVQFATRPSSATKADANRSFPAHTQPPKLLQQTSVSMAFAIPHHNHDRSHSNPPPSLRSETRRRPPYPLRRLDFTDPDDWDDAWLERMLNEDGQAWTSEEEMGQKKSKNSANEAAVAQFAQRVRSVDAISSALALPAAVRELLGQLSFTPQAAVSLLAIKEPCSYGSDVWPDLRDGARLPMRYTPVPSGHNVITFLQKYAEKSRLRSKRKFRDRQGVECSDQDAMVIRWPAAKLPQEMYTEIMKYLSRDDIKALRLTRKEAENFTTHKLFENVVVPFNTEIYGMLCSTGAVPKASLTTGKGKGKAKAVSTSEIPIVERQIWQNQNNDDIYEGHGLSVFNQFGKHLKKFGMSFEVDEQQLARPPLKGAKEAHTSYWGQYEWPYQEYRRFDEVAGLENAADEMFRMKTAFSFFNDVKELGLSIDSGLGWLHGPDMSLRSLILRKKSHVFGRSRAAPERYEQAHRDFWELIKTGFQDASSEEDGGTPDLKHAVLLAHKPTQISRSDFQLIAHMARDLLSSELAFPYVNLNGIARLETELVDLINEWQDAKASPQCSTGKRKAGSSPFTSDHVKRLLKTLKEPDFNFNQDRALADFGLQNFAPRDLSTRETIMYVVKQGALEDASKLGDVRVKPSELTKLQREWLLEMEWAQRAFLSSYMLAVHDNRLQAFQNVERLNFARISSRYLSSMCREDFWHALPNLSSVKIHVIPDWRDVVKDPAGYIQLPELLPSHAQAYFWQLLGDIISRMKQVRTLDIGWAAGGEHEIGLCGRNKHLMPAPIIPWSANATNIGHQETANNVLQLHYVENLTLSNCWITPACLASFVEAHQRHVLRRLTLDSVSLTAALRSNNNHNANAGNQAGGHNFVNAVQAQAWAAVHPNGGNLNAQVQAQNAVAPPPPPPAIQNNPNAVLLWNQWHANGGQAQAGNAHQHVLGGGVAAQQAPAPTNVTWLGPHREGSWPWILDRISPGETLTQHGGTESPANLHDGTVPSALQTIVLKSCGYARLPLHAATQSVLEPQIPFRKTPWLAKREEAVSAHMLKNKDVMLGEIVQHMPTHESEALRVGWSCLLGWVSGGGDELAQFREEEEPEAPEFDGVMPGGTGRFSGIVDRSSRREVDEEMMDA